jgi:hypothetical protein
MRLHRLSVLTAALATACASGAARPSFEFQPTAGPLRYEVRTNETSSVETPDGAEESTGRTSATVVVTVGQAEPDGLQVSAVYESLEGYSSDRGSYEGGALIGEPFSGLLMRNGTIRVTDGPETPTALRAVFDPRAFLAELMSPMPPAGSEGAESWPVRRETTWDMGFTITTLLEGSGRVVGDTTWNGIAAKVIVVQGEARVTGSGTPPGSPVGELEFLVTGPETIRCLWDAERGVMLALDVTQNLSGDVTIVSMGLTLPLDYTGEQTTTLKR